MPLIRCPHCGDDTFTIAGWADLDHCATCGRPLGERRIEIGAALAANERLAPRPGAIPDRRDT
jgi:hypothetical protein